MFGIFAVFQKVKIFPQNGINRLYPLMGASLCQDHSQKVTLNDLVKHIFKDKLEYLKNKGFIPSREECKCFQALEPEKLLKCEITFNRGSLHQDMTLNVTFIIACFPQKSWAQGQGHDNPTKKK